MLLTPPLAIRVAGDVEPVSSPAFAITRRREQPIDELGVGVRTLVGQKGLGFGRLRRQPGEIERSPAQEGKPIRLGRQRQPFFLQLLEHEGIDRIAYPV